MAVIQISRIQVRRGLQEDLPQLASAEFGWAMDSRKLYIGNGTTEEGAPLLGNTEILTQYSDIFSLSGVYTFKGLAAGYIAQTGESPLAPTTRSMQDKFDDFANLRDFGAIGDGRMHDTSGNGEGDGLLEIRALNRAIAELHKASIVGSEARTRRTIYIPAGVYVIFGDFIRLMPYVRLKGDGKNSTFLVQASELQPCLISSCDSKLRTGFPYHFLNGTSIDSTTIGAGSPQPVMPGYAEIEDLSLVNANNKDIAYLNTVSDVRFTRVGFYGSDTISPTSVGATPASCVRMASAQANNLQSEKLVFNECDFSGKVYAFYADSKVNTVNFSACTFDRLYRGLNLGQSNDGAPFPSSIKVTGSTFDNIAAEAIYGESSIYNGTKHIVSSFNTFNNVGQGLTLSTAVTPVISLGGDNCYSIGDLFARASTSAIQATKLNGRASFATMSDGRIMLGKQYSVGGKDIELSDNLSTSALASVVGFADYPTILEYTILRGDDQRNGTILVSSLGASVVFSDDYVETNDIGVDLIPTLNTNTIELRYTTSLLHKHAVLKIASRTLIGDRAPVVLPNTVPDAPFSVVATLNATVPYPPTQVIATLNATVPFPPTQVIATLNATVPFPPTAVVASLGVPIPVIPI